MRKTLIGILALMGTCTMAQDIQVKGGFLTDSLLLGMPVDYFLTAHYPLDIDLFLPDSSFDFKPFEYHSRQLFPTQVVDNMAFDSVVYSLQSFEIDAVQYLRLPAYVFRKKDTLRVFNDADSIYFRELVEVATDTTALKTNTDYWKLSTEVNTPLLLIIGGVLLVLALTVLLVFGKKIRRHFRLKRMAKAHQVFTSRISGYIVELKQNGAPNTAEEALTQWKTYQEKIEQLPFSKLTSKEILRYDFASELAEPLRAADRCVYGKMPSTSVYQDFQHLLDFSEMRYSAKIEEIKHGKN